MVSRIVVMPLVHRVAPRFPITATGREVEVTAADTASRRALRRSASLEFDARSPQVVTTSMVSPFAPTVMRYTGSVSPSA